jgi:hypothetical protein
MSTNSSSSQNDQSVTPERRQLAQSFIQRTPAQLAELPDNERANAIQTALTANAAAVTSQTANDLLDKMTTIMASPLFARAAIGSEVEQGLPTKLVMSSLSTLDKSHANNVLEVAFFLWKLSQATGLTWSARAIAARTKCNGASAFTSSASHFSSDCTAEADWNTSCKGVLVRVDPNYQTTISELVSSPKPIPGDFAAIRDNADKVFTVHRWVSRVLCAGTESDVGCTEAVRAKLLMGLLPPAYQARVRDSLVSHASQDVTFDMVCTTVSNLERSARANASGYPVAAVVTTMAALTTHGAIPYDASAAGAMGRCFSCGQDGHNAVSCPSIVCYKCKQKGHMAANCPTLASRDRDLSPQRRRGRSRDRDRDRNRDRDRDPTQGNNNGLPPRICRRCDRVCGKYLSDCPKYEGCGNCKSRKHLTKACDKPMANSGAGQALQTGNRLN